MTNTLAIVADDKIPFLKGVLEPYANVRYIPGNEIKNADLAYTDALIVRTRTTIDEALIKGTAIKFIASATIGFDHIDTDACQKWGVQWMNAPGCNSGSVYQYMAAALTHLSNANNFDFADRTLGIVGVGNVGSKVEKLGRILGFSVLLNDPPRARVEGSAGFTSLDTLLAQSDIISFHVPLILSGIDKTFEMLNAETIRHIKPGAWIINTSRGDIVDESALLTALTNGSLNGAILDVWKNEPEIHTELLNNVYLGTPHIAGYSLDGKANGTSQAIRNLADFFNLKLDVWYPENIPAPAESNLKRTSGGKQREEILKDYIHATYDIQQDSNSLKHHIRDFEYLRGHYPPRREFHAYFIDDNNISEELKQDLVKLGFNIK